MQVSIATCVGERTRAITLQHGSRCALKLPDRANRFEEHRNRCGRRLSGWHRPHQDPNADHFDGDSFAHRSYHALPKTILRRGRKPAGAILGFANMLLRFYRDEQPRAVLVAWDTLEVPTYRHQKFPAYQSGREFDD